VDNLWYKFGNSSGLNLNSIYISVIYGYFSGAFLTSQSVDKFLEKASEKVVTND
jgi:hypothetical protein